MDFFNPLTHDTMGQYLAIGLATRIAADRKKAADAGLDDHALALRMQESLGFVPANYQSAHTDTDWVWQLRTERLASDLIPLLEAVYPLLYPAAGSGNDTAEVLAKLAGMPPEEWLPWMKEASLYSFQDDRYGSGDSLRTGTGSRIPVYYRHVALSMEGKIVMEEYGRHFRFFQHCIAAAFPSLPLAGSLRVYITG